MVLVQQKINTYLKVKKHFTGSVAPIRCNKIRPSYAELRQILSHKATNHTVKEIEKWKKDCTVTKIEKNCKTVTGTPIFNLSTELQIMIFENLPGCAALCLALTCKHMKSMHTFMHKSSLAPSDWNQWSQSAANLMAFDLSLTRARPQRLHSMIKIWMGEEYAFCSCKEKFVKLAHGGIPCGCFGRAKLLL